MAASKSSSMLTLCRSMNPRTMKWSPSTPTTLTQATTSRIPMSIQTGFAKAMLNPRFGSRCNKVACSTSFKSLSKSSGLTTLPARTSGSKSGTAETVAIVAIPLRPKTAEIARTAEKPFAMSASIRALNATIRFVAIAKTLAKDASMASANHVSAFATSVVVVSV